MPSDLARLMMIMALAAYAGGALTALLGRRAKSRPLVAPGLLLLGGAVVFNTTALAVRGLEAPAPLSGTFDAFAVLSLLAAVMSGYLKLVDRRRMPELVLLPIAAALAAAAVATSGWAYRSFPQTGWQAVHLAGSLAGVACFTAAAGAGVLYLRTHARLRRKDPDALASRWPSLERLERFMRHAMPVGFALLTATIVAGAHRALLFERDLWGRTWWKHPKILLAVAAWVVYAVALHAAYGKHFRGRRAALLSIAGLILLAAVLLLSLLLPNA